MKPSKTEYRGGEALKLSTKAFELTVTTSVGPRIVDLRARRGEAGNLLLEMPEDEPRANGFLFRGGHRLWHSPEDIVRTYQPDDSPLKVKLVAEGVALTQPTEEKTGIQKGLKLEVKGPATLRLTHTLTNRGLWTIETAPWALTMMRPGGYGVLPLLPKGSHAAGDLLPTYSLVPWSYTDLALPVWKFHRDYLGIDVPSATEPQKLGITNYPGWSAYWVDGVTFVKYAAVKPGATYPDFGSAFETFTNGEMIEFETLGAFGKLEPGDTASHVEHWTVMEGLEKPNTDETFAALAKAVKKWLASL
jgi:hypothetical protein